MIRIEVQVGDVERLLARMDGATVLERAFRQLERPLRDAFATYPPPSRKPQRFVSQKQRRYFFWALRAGRIQVPYQRTGDLGRGWKSQVTRAGDGVYLVFVNQVAYAGGVVGAKQWRYHAGTWPRAVDTVKKFEPAIRTAVVDEVRKAVRA